MRRIIIGVSREIEYDLRNDFFAHLQRLPPEYFRRHRTGDLMSRATNDLNAVRMMAGPSIMYASQTTLVFVVAIVLMLSIDPRLTLIGLLPLPLVSVSVKVFGAAIHRRFERIQAQLSELSAVAQENLSGVRVVRAYGQESAELARFRAANEEYIARNRGLIRLQGAFYPEHDAVSRVSARCWCCGKAAATSSRDGSRVGELVAFNAYLVMLAWPMIAFGWVTNMLQRGMASWKRMLEILDEAPSIADPRASASRSTPLSVRGLVEVRDLTFSHGSTTVLQDLNFAVQPGQTAAIVGPTGSGKSTLLQTAAAAARSAARHGVHRRHRRPRSAARRRCGASSAWRRRNRSSSRTRSKPTSRSRQKWRRCLPSARREVVERSAGMARLDKDVADFPKGFDTLVGERGITLSGGQKQRTALARALATDPRVLVLDDALSAVDTYTEEEILQRLKQVRRRPDVPHRRAPGLDGPRCRRHLRPRPGAHRRARIARRARRARRRVCGAASQAVAGRGAGSNRGRRCGGALRRDEGLKDEGRRARRTKESKKRT